MPADASIYGLQQAPPRFNTPFENLASVLQIRNQQESAAALREQRQAMADERRLKAEETRREAAAAAQVRSLFSRPNQPPTPEELASVIGPEAATKIFQGFEALKTATGANQDATRARIASVLGAIKAFPEALRPGAYDGARAHLIADGTLKPEDAPEKYEPTFIDNALRAAMKPSEQIALDKPKDDYTLGDQRFSGATNKPIATAAPDAPKLGSFEDFVSRYASTRRLKPEQLSAGDIAKAKAQFEAAGRAPEKPTYEWANVGGENKYLTPDEIRKQGGTKPMTATEALDERKYKKAEPVLRGIAELSEKINTQQGLIAKMGGGAAKIAAKANYDDDVAEYQALIAGFTPMVARALGHTGVLTQQDVDSVRALFPLPGDSKTLRDRKMARVRGIIDDLEAATSSPAKPSKPTTAPAGETPEARIKRLLGGG